MRWSAAVLVCGFPVAAHAADPIHKTFSDWTLSCDNTGTCVALGADDDNALSILISRDAGGRPGVEIIGDCDESASWVFDGKDFQLSQYAVMDRCAGLSPDLWPALWRSRAKTEGATQ